MPVSPTPMNGDQLRQLLAERSDPARNRPVPQERIAARIRRARIHRAAGAGLLALAVAAGVVSGVNLAHEHASMTSYSGPPLPARFTASDGAAYRRVAVTSMTSPDQRSAALTVTVGSEPVDVMGGCDVPKSEVFIIVTVNGANAGLFTCQDPPQLIGLSVPPGHQAHITFANGSSLGQPDPGWRFAAYAWTPPVTLRPAPAKPRLPFSYTGYNTTTGHGKARLREIAGWSGDWPGDRTVTITVPAGNSNLDISMACAGAIAARLQVSISSPGMQGEQTLCQAWSPGQPPPEQTTISTSADAQVKLTFRFQAPSPDTAAAYAKRAASWTIAVYEEQT